MDEYNREFIKEKYAEGLEDVEIARQVPYSLIDVRAVIGSPFQQPPSALTKDRLFMERAVSSMNKARCSSK